ncbi:MAG: F0F1 ATP synthase subunit B [bacterium]|nr:F0F1 ATP synthase subunit B [bacterium]
MISINVYEIALQTINIAILIWLLKKFMTAPLSNFLKERAENIKHNIEEAESKRTESERVLTEQKELLKKAHQDAQEVRTKAEAAAKTERETSLQTAKEESAQFIQNAKREIELEYNQVRQSLTEDAARLSIALSEKIMRKSLKEEDNDALIKEYLEQAKN